MRLLVSDQGVLAEIYRVNFYKSKHRSVIGEQLLFDYLQALIPQGTNFHSHFIYVETGDYHYSIKYFDTAENVYVDRKTYYNHIAIRKGPSPNFAADIPFQRRDIDLNDPLDSFMMGERLKPWVERPFGHHFGTVALNLAAGKQTHLPWHDKLKVENDDLVINLDNQQANIINLGVAVYSQDNPSFASPLLPPDGRWIEKSICKDDVVLRLNIVIV